LVIGGGPAGLMAARAAGRAGARVILADEDFRLGGRLVAERFEIDGKPGIDWVAEVEAELASLPDVRIMRRTAVTGVFDHGQYGAVERVNDHVPVPPRTRAAPAQLEDRCKACGARGWRARTLDRVRKQRSARRDARRRDAHLHQSLRRGAGTAHRGVHNNDGRGWRTGSGHA
jgi:monoamine oxidase